METKYCHRCDTLRPVCDFHKAKSRKDGLQTACKYCMKELHAKWYKVPENKSAAMGRSKDWRVKMRAVLLRLKRMYGCHVCNENEPVALDFHHLDPSEKEFKPTELVGFGRETIKRELSKCVILCSNCHRKVHGDVFSLWAQGGMFTRLSAKQS